LEEDKEIQKYFKLELTNRFQILTDMEGVENETIEKNGGRYEPFLQRQVKKY